MDTYWAVSGVIHGEGKHLQQLLENAAYLNTLEHVRLATVWLGN